MSARPPSVDRRTAPEPGAPGHAAARARLTAAVLDGSRPSSVDWTLTLYATAIVRVHLPAGSATTQPAELSLWTRRRCHRFVEQPRAVDGADRPEMTATFEVPVAMLHRKGVRAQVRIGGIASPIDWSELVRLGPRPALACVAGASLTHEAAAPGRAATPATGTARGIGGVGGPGVGGAASPRRRSASPVQPATGAAARAAARGRPQPLARPHPTAGGACPAAADGPGPITVDSALLQFFPYEQAAPRLAVPISLTGDVLTVAVALPSVDLSVITDRTPWLRIEREVTGYQRIVQALREVEAMDQLRPADDAWMPGRASAAPADAPHDVSQRDEAGSPDDDPDERAAAGVAGDARRRPERAAAQRRSRRSAAEALAGAIGTLSQDRRGQVALGTVAGVAATAALLSLAPPESGMPDAPARVALDTTACIAALAAAWLALASHRSRRSATSLALLIGLGAVALTTVLAIAGLRGPAAAASPAWAGEAGLSALVVAALALAAGSRRRDDALLAWCSIGALSLALAHVGALAVPPGPESHVSAADLLRLAALACFLVGGARELAVHGRRSASAAVAAERRRMARELHDGVAQELAFIVSQASSLARHEPPEGPLQDIALAGERALMDSRRSIHKLTSPEGSTLREAITEQASQWARRAGLQLEVELSEDVETTPEVQHAILRIVQEAISNAVRHSGATKVMVSLSERDGSVTVRISDDGRGFDPQPRPEQPEGGFGLVSMAERAEASGGELRLESEPGRGTVVEVAFR